MNPDNFTEWNGNDSGRPRSSPVAFQRDTYHPQNGTFQSVSFPYFYLEFSPCDIMIHPIELPTLQHLYMLHMRSFSLSPKRVELSISRDPVNAIIFSWKVVPGRNI